MYTHECAATSGLKENIATADLESVLPEELEEEVRQAAEISMGTEVRHWAIVQACRHVNA